MKSSVNNNHPVSKVMWVDCSEVEANDYNMNSVAKTELALLAISIQNDGFTMPIVTIYDKEKKKYVIVDGFHRFYLAQNDVNISKLTNGKVPIVVIDKPIGERIASTIRHNRARGKHSVAGMSNAVFKMLDEGMKDADICFNLGMEAEELAKLKHITGFSRLFENVEYSKAWITRQQIKEKNKVQGDYM